MKKSVLGTYGLQILNIIFGFFMSIIIARILGASERGELVIFLTSTNFMSTLMEFCLSSAIIYYVASDKVQLAPTVTTVIYWTLIAFLISILVIVISPVFHFQPLLFGEKSPELGIKINFIIVAALGVFNSLLNAIFLAKKLFKLSNFLTLGTVMLTSSTYVVLWLLNHHKGYIFSAHTFILTTTIILSIKTLVLVLLYAKYISVSPSVKPLDPSSLKLLISLSTINYISNTVQFLSYRMDFWFVNYYSGSKELGIYSLAVNLAQLFWLLPNAVGAVLFPNIASMEPKKALEYAQLLCRIIFTSTIILGLVGGTLLGYLIPFIYGIEFSFATKLFFILLIGIVPFSLKIIIASYYSGINKTKLDMMGSLIGFIFCLIADIFLIPRYGSTGASVATVIAYSSNTFFMITSFKLITNSSLSSFLVIKRDDIRLIMKHFTVKLIPIKPLKN
jgi:O-antigen/teichoic acid export membrane protein